MGEDQSDDRELDRPIILRILDGIAWDFAQAKWWRWWKTMRCGGSILSYCPRNPHGKAGNEERRRRRRRRRKKSIQWRFTETSNFVGVGKQARRHGGILGSCPLLARNVFPRVRIVLKKSNKPGATGVHFGACIPYNTACAPPSVSKVSF